MTRLPMPNLTESDIQRLWAGVDVGNEDECWLWKRGKAKNGYGIFVHRRICYVTTRIMYYHIHGIDPGDKDVCHTCDAPGCCNPKHLWLGTQSQNMQDCINKGRARDNKGEQHPRARLTEQDILEIRNSDQRVVELASRFSVTPTQIYRIRIGEKWAHVGGPVRARRPARKLTLSQIKDIRILYITGAHTKSALGRQFGVSRTHIGRLVA